MLGVFGLNPDICEHHLEDLFAPFGKVDKVTIVYDPDVRVPHFR